MTDFDLNRPPALNGWRIAGWGALLALAILPAIAMRITDSVQWTAGDFLFAAVLLGALGTGVEIAMRIGKGKTHKAALIAAAFTGFVTLWVNAAVGIIGDGTINTAFPAMVLGALVASIVVRLRPRAMRAIMAAVIVGTLGVGIAAELTSQPDWAPVLFFVLLWLVPALLFRQAATAAS